MGICGSKENPQQPGQPAISKPAETAEPAIVGGSRGFIIRGNRERDNSVVNQEMAFKGKERRAD